MQVANFPRVAIVVLGALAAACSSSPSDPAPVASACAPVAIDRFKELLVVDDAVVTDPRASNSLDGPWSFRERMRELAGGSEADARELTMGWLRQFGDTSKVNLFSVPSRPQTNSVLICPWLKRTDANECNQDCSTCTKTDLDLAKAPFRLIGIANRLDLHDVEPARRGEARYVYALTDGASDAASSAPMRMTIGFEYALPATGQHTVRSWAERWHALGSHATFDASYRADLAALLADVAAGETSPGPLAQLRTNDRELEWDWSMREFKLSNGALVEGPVFNTPDRSLNAGPELAAFVLASQAAVLKDNHVVPTKFIGGNSSPAGPWSLPQVPENLRKAFARNTCDGCHQTEATPADINFHISPFRAGVDRVSPFLSNPAAPETDELARRAEQMQTALCGL